MRSKYGVIRSQVCSTYDVIYDEARSEDELGHVQGHVRSDA